MIKLQHDNKNKIIPGIYDLLPLWGSESALVDISPQKEYRVRVGLPGGEKELIIPQSDVGISVASSGNKGTLSIGNHYCTLHVPGNMIDGYTDLLPVPLFYGRPPALRRSCSYSSAF